MNPELNILPEVPMCLRERKMLALLEGGQVVQRARLMQLFETDMALSLAIHRLRKKLPEHVQLVTHRGVGFSLVGPLDRAA